MLTNLFKSERVGVSVVASATHPGVAAPMSRAFSVRGETWGRSAVAPLAVAAVLFASGAQAQSWPTWDTVVNNGMLAPLSTGQTSESYYFSYNQPSINDSGLAVFRARAKPLSSGSGSEAEGGGGGGTQGIYTRDMSLPGSPINVLADNKGGVTVPSPNTTGATFNEFPSVPRIDATSSTVVFRGGSQRIYTLPDGTKSGTSGVYMNSGGRLITGASQLGDAGLTQFAVPNAPPGTGFDQFPGAPAVTNRSSVVFKGNYTVNGVAETGVFFRNTSLGPTAPVESIAQYGQPIPGFPGAVFGSTAPPSAAASKVVFTGWNNEEAPTAGGIYLAPLAPNPTLRSLAKIGEVVPNTGGQTFSKFGEGLSFDGGNVGFWASWGTATMTVHVACGSEGMAAAYCKQLYPNGADLTEPLHQGIFSLNTATDALTMIAQTGQNGYTDFLNWTFSGRVPGSENENDGEPARWRSSAYLSDSSGNVVFLGQKRLA